MIDRTSGLNSPKENIYGVGPAESTLSLIAPLMAFWAFSDFSGGRIC